MSCPTQNEYHEMALYLSYNILSDVYMFADDTKIFNIIKSPEDQETLQNDLDTLSMWSDKWLLKFHPEKCKVMHLGKAGDTEYSYKGIRPRQHSNQIPSRT